MKKLGKVAVITNKGDLLVRAPKPIRINSCIVNQELKTIGKVVDIIGPVSAPYIVVNTRQAEATAKKDETLYLFRTEPSRQKKSPRGKRTTSSKRTKKTKKKS